MSPALIDTSVWIDYFHGKENRQTMLTRNLLEEEIPVFTCPIVIQEVLQGIRIDSDYEKVKLNLLSMEVLKIEQTEAAIGAADLYRLLRKKGLTIRKTNDCTIAYYAIYFGLHLLHNDNDFNLIARKTSLNVL
jgi:predicted nucleic acid-binding protein